MKAIKTLFLGSNWESLEALKTLNKDDSFEIVGVITQPDKPAGRNQILTPTLVKQYASENNIPVFLTESKEEKYREALEVFKPDIIVCKAFGEIIPEFFLEYPKYKSINIHFSLLPKYRGAVPIQMAILNGDEVTGVTFVQMVAKLDAGKILKKIEEPILPNDTNQSLRERLVNISAKALPEVLIDWINGKIIGIEQDESMVTFCWQKDISKDKAEIKWSEMSAIQIDRMVRAFIPWPVAWCMFNGKRMKIFEVKISDLSYNSNEEYNVIDKKLIFKTKEGFIEVLELQIEGKTKVNSSNFTHTLT